METSMHPAPLRPTSLLEPTRASGAPVSAEPARARLWPATLVFVLGLLQGCASAPQQSETTASAVVPTAGQATKIRPATPITPQLQAQLDAALALLKAEQYEKSVDVLKKLAAAMPDNSTPPINLALAYEKLGKTELAEAQLKQALELDPDNPVAANELALLYRHKGRFAEARAIYEKLLAKYQNFQLARKNLAILCDLYLRDYACALTHYRIYAENAPQDKNVAIWIADLQKRNGN